MRKGSPNCFRAARLLVCALVCTGAALSAVAQNGPEVGSLLARAHNAEVTGRLDVAKDFWKRVLLVDPNSTQALAGLARASKSEGNAAQTQYYLERLRTVSPNDPAISQVEGMQSSQARSARMQEADRLAQSGEYNRAMDLQRQAYGNTPPPGDAALSYFQTQAGSPQGREAAVRGLRAYAAKYPDDPRYQVALGKVLTYTPSTRREGRRILERFPYNTEALEALRSSLLWDVKNPAVTGDIRAYLSRHPDPDLEAALNQALAGRGRGGYRGGGGTPLSPAQRAERADLAARSAEERKAYAALNAHKYAEADALFRSILAKHPQSCQSLAGLGYVRMSQSNFAGAISFLEQAQQDGCKEAAIEHALHDSRFFYTVQVATTALNDNDLFTAEKEFELALKLRPDDPSALLGLGGTLLKAQQPEQALPVFTKFVQVAPGDPKAWRGLFMAQYGATKYVEALDTERRIPPPVKAQLMKDPDYLRTLGSVYLAQGRDADAQRVFQEALNLPFPNGGRGLKVDVQLQYAALLATIGRRDQAAGLYRQVLQVEPQNTSAWIGLVQIEHALGHDAVAYDLLQKMPPQILAAAMQEAGFETSVAAIYEGVGHDELAQEVLEKFLNKQEAEGKKPFVSAEVQLAAIYIRRGQAAQAYALYRKVLTVEPNRADAWMGVLSSLHSTEHDREALAQIQVIPAPVRAQLENDPAYLQVVGSIYSGLGDNRQAALFFNRVTQHYAALHQAPPADVQIQQAWMLYNSGADAALYNQLMILGGRQDMTERQRLTVATIWTDWAVRRANQNIQAGNYRRAIAILNAAAQFSGNNPALIKALASGYASAGMAKEAVAIYRAEDLNNAPVTDYRSAVGAALSANDLRDAEIWLRFGLERYPKDAPLLILAAKFEQARGDANRAADYYRASLAAMPAVDPAMMLATELSHPAPRVPMPLPSKMDPQDLATLLSQPDKATRGDTEAQHIYLPSYLQPSVDVPVPMGQPSYGNQVPVQPSTQNNPSLRDYMPPQSRLDAEPSIKAEKPVEAVIHLHTSPAMEAKYGPYVSYDPSAGVPHFTSSPRALGDGVVVAASTDGAPVTARMQQTAWHGQAQDSTPTVQYLPPSHPANNKPAPRGSQAARDRAAAIRANQAQGQSSLRGQSHPPAEDLTPAPASAAKLTDAQWLSQPYDTTKAQQVQQAPAGQVPQPSSQPRAAAPAPTYVPQAAPQSYSPPSSQDSYGQQYPQPGSGTIGGGPAYRPRRRSTPSKPATQAEPVQQSVPAAAPARTMDYPTPGNTQPLTNLGTPQTGTPYSMGTPPSDYDLEQRNLPPLRGYFDPRIDERQKLTPRQEAEFALATIEGSYSGWVGGTAIGHYRSGTPGIDRLGSLEVPIEISLVAGKTIRLSVIPRAVFLTSGQLDTLNSNLGSQPVLGTLPGNALNPPAQQFASGIGGEVQIATNTFSAGVGVSPYEFLVTNIIGHGQWRPLNGHVLLSGFREPVKETQLSYAGLRDPGSATPVFSGNVWGGVVQTGGGIRFDAGGERAGLYLLGEGAELTGFHVLENKKFDGTMGMYFHVNTWPEYGSLTLGGLFYGMHFDHNERGQTFGLGGYFSPESYFLAAVPVTFNGHYGNNLHYVISSSLGVQTFQEENQTFFPLDPGLAASVTCSPVQIATHSCGQFPVNSNTGMNYSFNTQVSYRVTEHWFVNGFLGANNTNNYNSVTGGFSARYMFRPQVAAPDYPTGLFPVEGFRPLQVP